MVWKQIFQFQKITNWNFVFKHYKIWLILFIRFRWRMAITCVLIQICFIQIIPERAIRSSDPPGNPRESGNFRQESDNFWQDPVGKLSQSLRWDSDRKLSDPTGSDKNFIAKLATNQQQDWWFISQTFIFNTLYNHFNEYLLFDFHVSIDLK